MILKLKTKLAMSFILISLITICLISVITNIAVSAEFKKHIRDKQDRRDDYFSEMLETNYSPKGYPAWVSEKIDMYAMMDSLYIVVNDVKGNEMFKSDYLGHYAEMKDTVMSDIYHNDNKYSEKSRKLYKKGNFIGTIKIGFEGSYSISAGDMNFLRKFNFWTFVAGFVSLMTAVFLNLFISKSISKPVVNATKTALEIRNGNTSVRIEDKEEKKAKDMKKIFFDFFKLKEKSKK